MTRERIRIEGREDVIKMLGLCWDDAVEHGFRPGEACFRQLPFFGAGSQVVDMRHQERIREWQYAKEYGHGPGFACTYERMIDFQIIEDECRQINMT